MAVLDPNTMSLFDEAKAAAGRAYCPYSHFAVGAALITDDKRIYSGCNVENASYGVTLCAERNAITSMVRNGGRKIETIVVYTPTDKPTTPCGACRQVINEFSPHAHVICICDGNERIELELEELLPRAFGPENLGGKQ